MPESARPSLFGNAVYPDNYEWHCSALDTGHHSQFFNTQKNTAVPSQFSNFFQNHCPLLVTVTRQACWQWSWHYYWPVRFIVVKKKRPTVLTAVPLIGLRASFMELRVPKVCKKYKADQDTILGKCVNRILKFGPLILSFGQNTKYPDTKWKNQRWKCISLTS